MKSQSESIRMLRSVEYDPSVVPHAAAAAALWCPAVQPPLQCSYHVVRISSDQIGALETEHFEDKQTFIDSFAKFHPIPHETRVQSSCVDFL